MADIDSAVVMDEHSALHVCVGGLYWNMRVGGDQCEPYRLAEALAASEAKVERARALPSYVDGERLAWVDAQDLRVALADQPEQAS